MAEKTEHKPLTLEQCAAHGIEDYSERFAKIKGANNINTDVFGDLLHQDDTVKNFARALALNRHGILNLGAPGTGKSTLINGLETALRKLERNEEIHGEYAPAVKEFYDRLKAIPRGDIVSFWNPNDYDSPILVRVPHMKNGDSVPSKVSVEVLKWHTNLFNAFADTLRTYNVREEAHETLRNRIAKPYITMKQKGMTYELKEKKGFRRILIKGLKKKSIQKEYDKAINETIEQLMNHVTIEEAQATIKELLENGLDNLMEQENVKKQDAKYTIERLSAIVREKTKKFVELAERWQEEYPFIASWYRDVAAHLARPENTKVIAQQVLSKQTELPKQTKQTSKQQARNLLVDGDFSIVTLGTEEYDLEDLLIPEIIYEEDSTKKLIIKKLGYFYHEDLFPRIKQYTVINRNTAPPPHSKVIPGILATAQLIIFDDGLREMFANPQARGPLLTFLQDGEISATQENVEMTIKNPSYIIANETEFPFLTQRFDGQKPEYDGGMHRRFSVIEWPRTAPHSGKTIDKFPAIMNRVSNDMKNTLKMMIGVTPEAMNLLYHDRLAESGSLDILSLRIGDYLKTYEELCILAREKGHKAITKEDVLDFFWSQRDKDLEAVLTKIHAQTQHYKQSRYEIGKVHGLGIDNHGVGLPFPINTILTGKLGGVSSIDTNAEMTDETHNKGVALAEAWLNSTLGPVTLEMKVVFSDYTGVGGPSASAAQTYALMSRLGNIQMKQDFFVTGTLLDQNGHIGPIGGVYKKVRGTYKTMQEVGRQHGLETMPVNCLIPRSNAPEFLRAVLFDRELQEAIEKRELNVYLHDTIWDGFELLTGGIKQERFKKDIKRNIAHLTKKAAANAYVLRNGGNKHK